MDRTDTAVRSRKRGSQENRIKIALVPFKPRYVWFDPVDIDTDISLGVNSCISSELIET